MIKDLLRFFIAHKIYPAKTEDGKMMFACPHCRHQFVVDEMYQYCWVCGQKMDIKLDIKDN